MWLVRDTRGDFYLCENEPEYIGGDCPTGIGFRIPIQNSWDLEDFTYSMGNGEAIEVTVVPKTN